MNQDQDQDHSGGGAPGAWPSASPADGVRGRDLADQLGRLTAVTSDHVDVELVASLRTLLGLLGMERAAVWQRAPEAPGTLVMTHACTLVDQPVPPRIRMDASFPWLGAQVVAGTTVIVPDVDRVTPEAVLDHLHFQQFGTGALVVIPFATDEIGAPGAVSFVSDHRRAAWPDDTVTMCRMFTQVIHSTLARRAADQVTRDERAILHAVLDSTAADQIWCVDAERHGMLTWNRAMELLAPQFGGLPPRVGMTVAEMFPASPAVVARWTACYDRALTTGGFTEELRLSNGRIYQLEVNPLHRAGVAIGASVFARDMTERRQTEDSLRQLSRAVEQAPISVVITGADGAIEYVNPRFTALAGYTLDEVRGKNPRLLKSGRMSADEYAGMWSTLVRGQVWHGEFHNRNKAGELYWERAAIAPVRDPDGQVTHFVRVGEDISASKQAEAELARVQEQLLQSQKLDAIGRLAGGIAHDFNNLLTVINALTADAIEQLGSDSPIATDLADVLKAGDRAADLTRQLLTFSRQQPRQARVVELGAILLDAEKLLRRVLREDITLEILPPAIPALVSADPSQLHQVIVNLTVNARDAMPHGGRLSIEVDHLTVPADEPHVLPPGPYVALRVRDTGQGIAPELLDRVFEPFFTTKEYGRGTGLGLATVLGIVTQSGGDVRLESALGTGTTVHIRLPSLATLPAVDDVVRPPRLAAGGETVLIAEDNGDVRRVLGRILRSCGYQVLLAADGAEALALATSSAAAIDLVVTDVVMPVMSGPALARALRQQCPRVAVLFTSGFSDVPPEELEGLAHAPLLPKPYSVNAVATAVRAALDAARALAHLP